MTELVRASVPKTHRARLLDLDASGMGARAPLLAAWSRASDAAPRDATALALGIAARVEPDPRAIEAFERLAARYRIAIVSNGSSEAQRLKLQRGGLLDRSPFFVSAELGAAKPSPEPFCAALSALDVRAEEALFVGDDLVCDIGGAAGVGMSTCWIARGQRHSGHHADLVVDHVGELPALLQAIGSL